MTEWISVKDRLPEIGQEVLVFRPYAHIHYDKNITIDARSGSERMVYDGARHDWHKPNYVTHWMPLPEAPKESTK